jgi:hypothetical protein
MLRPKTAQPKCSPRVSEFRILFSPSHKATQDAAAAAARTHRPGLLFRAPIHPACRSTALHHCLAHKLQARVHQLQCRWGHGGRGGHNAQDPQATAEIRQAGEAVLFDVAAAGKESRLEARYCPSHLWRCC